MEKSISEPQWQVLKTLLESEGELTTHQIVEISGIDHPMVMATLTFGKELGWLEISEQSREELVPTEGAKEQITRGLPERRILPTLSEKTRIPMREIAQIAKEQDIPLNEIIKWGSMRGWVAKDGGDLKITASGKSAMEQLADDEKALQLALKSGSLFIDELAACDIDPVNVKKFLTNRSTIVKLKPRTERTAKLTKTGREVLACGIRIIKERNVLTSDDITSGDWRQIKLRHYDVTLEAERVHPARIHLVQKIIQQTRNAFLEMGFTEIVSPQVESAFWDFDALFQPQDHPARDMQDTFYLTRPAAARLPGKEVVERVKLTHENGWETGSSGWGYRWSRDRARQTVLRTHTTASTIRALAENPNPPRKVFCVGKVFRNEAISYKHLPEFFQVDGIVIDEEANLSTLLGTLQVFYKKMGFDKVKFKPAFFPYTEPSAEVFVYMESKKTWLELGGSGIFRPEVTQPFGCKVPVLAWGLGLDRLAMIRYGIDDIRELFWCDFDKLKEVSLCQ
ncbi:phenylalanine--tRNA ligase subunit alpha [candidate division KSB1 bacterium]|nr:phenylalanine--tRNA ligase subunit alpha [candidate division KSB1 bacterium]